MLKETVFKACLALLMKPGCQAERVAAVQNERQQQWSPLKSCDFPYMKCSPCLMLFKLKR